MLGPDAVSVRATVDGAPAGVEWQDATPHLAVALPGPITAAPSVVVTASTPGWGDLSSGEIPVVLGDAPPLPGVAWGGPTTLEGSGTFPGRLDVVPSAVTGGRVCVSFGEAQSATPGVTIQLSALEACGPDDEPFSVAADLVVDGERPAPSSSACPSPPATGRPVRRRPGAGGHGAGDLPDDHRHQGRRRVDHCDHHGRPGPAPPCCRWRSCSSWPTSTGASPIRPAVASRPSRWWPRRRWSSPPAGAGFYPDHVTPLIGTRSHYELPLGLAVTRRATLNPFAEASVEVTSERGPVTAVPWMRIGQGRTLEVPSRFEHLVLLRSEPGKDTGRAIVVIPAEATEAETERVLHEALPTTNRLWDRVDTLLSTRPGR